MPLTARQLNRATLDRQHLLQRVRLEAAEAVRGLLALQAQEPASPYLALWNRLAGFDADDLDAAFAERVVIKASLLRITLHAVHADDHPMLREAMLPSLRAARLHDRRFTSAGLTTADADAVLTDLPAILASPRTSAEIEEALQPRFGDRSRALWWALKTFASLLHAPTEGPWSFGPRPRFVAAHDGGGSGSRDQPVARLLHRYLRAFGPASLKDFAQFTLLRRPVVLEAQRALGDEVGELEGPDGTALLDLAGADVPEEGAAAPPRLLPMWDSVLLAYADRSRIIPPEHRPHVIRRNGDVLPTLLVDGYVAGVWRATDGGIEATAFQRLEEGQWEGLAAEAAALTAFVAARDPAVYRRYGHWWDKGMPSAEVRLLTRAGRAGGRRAAR